MPSSVEDRLQALEKITEALVQHPKAFTMIFAAIFGALSENPETIRKIIAHLQDSLETSQRHGAHISVLAELSQAVTLLTSLLSARH